MLGGGTFTVQNKILPGAYINFVSAQNQSLNLGERGIVALGIELDYGMDNEIFEVTPEEFAKSSSKIFGYEYSNEKMKGLRDLFKHITKAYLYRLNSNGQKATNNFATAKYSGTRGNNLKIVIQKYIEDENKFNVETLLDNIKVDEQIVESSSELIDNEYVNFKKDSTLAVTAVMPLTGGSNGAVTGQSHQDFLDKLESYSFNSLGCLSKEKEITSLYTAYTKRLRDEQVVKYQTVLFNTAGNQQGVINLKNNTVEDETALIYWVIGIIAGCAINESNTNKVYDGEYTVKTDYTQEELKESIKNGEFVLHKVGNEVRVLADINSLVSISNKKGEDFKSNQTIRVLDQFAMDTANIFNSKYLGHIPNNEAGRISLWNDIVTIFKEYETLQAIENFDSKEITIE